MSMWSPQQLRKIGNGHCWQAVIYAERAQRANLAGHNGRAEMCDTFAISHRFYARDLYERALDIETRPAA